MSITGALIMGGSFLAGLVVGVYISDRHGVNCDDLCSVGNQAKTAVKKSVDYFRDPTVSTTSPKASPTN